MNRKVEKAPTVHGAGISVVDIKAFEADGA